MTILGFDTDIYPGDAMMERLRAHFDFVAFYLAPAPSHGDTSWMPKLAYLRSIGYGLVPVYVGQELVGPGRHNVTGRQGTLDAADAVHRAQQAGFGPGTFIYLDLENGPPFTDEEAAYVTAFAAGLKAASFNIGIYGSHLYADHLKELVPEARIWTVHTRTTTAHDVEAADVSTPSPISFNSQAVVAQFDQSAVLTDFDRLEVDLDSSVIADPSRP